ncbi:uncharacterized protein LOC107621484 [Arachis ipaensis]|uniref:uncharacterized protein LOC107621484 n=1 Tax=Arachis ipaensis TaxID=130454 RepID=UPI0007AFDB73|nr:uncharacterized protein LOC107621484 [Arachis ipaensis]
MVCTKEAESMEVCIPEELKEEKAQEEMPLLHALLGAQESEIPRPQEPQEEIEDKNHSQFLEAPKKLQINTPVAEVLKSSPSEKKALKGDEIEVLIEKYNTPFQNKLPRKMPNPESFQILCTIGKITVDKALCDLDLSLNLIPLSVRKKLGIQEAQATRITLHMDDQSLWQTYGLEEKALNKVGELFPPTDSMILDKGEATDGSIILKKPFIVTGRALISVERGKMALWLHEDWRLFKVFKPQLPPDKGGTCIQNLAFKPPTLDGTNSIPPTTKRKFGVGCALSTKEEGSKRKMPRG